MKSWLVTGAGGFVGKNLVAALLREGHRVTALLHPREASIRGAIAARSGSSGDGLTRLTERAGDITAPETLVGVAEGCDGVIHLAGAVGYGQTWEKCRAVNVAGTENIARAALASGLRRFIHMSSVSVFGRVAGRSLTERSPLVKIGDPYGDTKIDAERVLWRLCAEGSLDLTVLRPTVIYGPGDDKFFPKLIENVRSGRGGIIGDGRNRVDLLHVDDLVEFILLASTSAATFGQAYVLANESNPTWEEFLAELCRLLQVPPVTRRLSLPLAKALAGAMELVSTVTRRPPRLTRYAAEVVGKPYFYSAEKAKRELGFVPRVPLSRGLAEQVAREGPASAGGS